MPLVAVMKPANGAGHSGGIENSKSVSLNNYERGIKRELTHCEDVCNIMCAFSLTVFSEGDILPVAVIKHDNDVGDSCGI